jgi:hypothetical protein
MPRTVETGGDRVAMAKDAGMGRPSLLSVLAGTLVAYGSFAVLVAIAAAIAEAVDVDTDLATNQWRELGIAGGAVVAGLLLICYLFGGYVAGRMARRAGVLNGALVFVLSLLVAVGVTGLVNLFADSDAILQNLRNVGIPTSGDEWGDIATVAGIGSLLAMLLGSLLGGVLGDRWHGKLITRAVDPTIGPTADTAYAAPAPPPPPPPEPSYRGSAWGANRDRAQRV